MARNKTFKTQRIASKIAKKKLTDAFGDAFLTGTVQLDANGGAWVHCMIFVPPIDIEEHVDIEEHSHV